MKSTDSYYAVIFSSTRNPIEEGYQKMSELLFEKVQTHPGFIELESYRNADGKGVTIAYFKDEASIQAWKNQQDHQVAQRLGKEKWYSAYRLRIAKVERDYAFKAD